MVTVIIVNYFSASLTVRASFSVLEDVPDAQVVVVDNSADKQEFSGLKAALPGNVECLDARENLGFGRGCNLAYEYARYEWILLLNPDAYVLAGCIGNLVQFLSSHPRAGGVAPLVFWDKECSWYLPPAQLPTPIKILSDEFARCSRRYADFVSLRFRQKAVKLFRAKQAVAQEMLSGGHMLLRKSALVTVGGLFDPEFFMFYEDTDLCLRLREKGYKLYLLPQALAVHEWRSSQTKYRLGEQSRDYYFRKHFSGSRLPAWSERLRKWFPAKATEYCDLGVLDRPPLLEVPERMRHAWLLELSPQSNFVPALYHFGSGEGGRLPDELWQRLEAGDYFFRLGPVEGGGWQTFRMRIERSA